MKTARTQAIPTAPGSARVSAEDAERLVGAACRFDDRRPAEASTGGSAGVLGWGMTAAGAWTASRAGVECS